MNSFKVIHENSEYDYITALNGELSDAIDYFVGKSFNRGGMKYDHETGQVNEVTDLQTPVNVAQVISSNDFNKDDLYSVRIFDLLANTREPSVYSPRFKGVMGFVEDNKPFYNAAILSQEGDPSVPDVKLLIFATHLCHGKVHRLLVENGKKLELLNYQIETLG